jgi:pimeloyl-ACP methyl ester carboxylesterase
MTVPVSSSIVFAHANGYPPGVYTRFLSALAALLPHDRVEAPPLETPPDLRASRRWPYMLGQLDHAIAASGAQTLIGHSMGGYLCLQVAAARPAVRVVVLIDSPIPTGWRAHVLSFAQLTGLAYRAGPAPVAARRRDRWPSRSAAAEHFAGKPFVQRWAPGVLDHFLDHALEPTDDGSVRLRIPRHVERDIYAHIVHRKAFAALRSLRRRGVPVHFIAGERSEEIRLAGRAENRRLFSPHWHPLPTGHLIPLEAPDGCAERIAEILQTHRT